MHECPRLRMSTCYFCWYCKKWWKEIGEEFQETLSRHVHLLRLLAMLRNTSSAATITAGGAGDLVSLTSPLIRYSTNHFYLFIMMKIIIVQPINTLVNYFSKLGNPFWNELTGFGLSNGRQNTRRIRASTSNATAEKSNQQSGKISHVHLSNKYCACNVTSQPSQGCIIVREPYIRTSQQSIAAKPYQ